MLANRVWHYHFGRGIVGTPSDFGENGAGPTHPRLLDYLASRLVQVGWRLKPLHREIVRDDRFRIGDVSTRFMERFRPQRPKPAAGSSS